MTKISTAGMSRAEWLALRQRGIGGSDASAIMGVNPYRSAWSVWADKTGLLPAEDETEAMRQGRDLEDYVARRFMEATSLRTRRSNYLLASNEYPWMIANIDRWVISDRCGLECKTSKDIYLQKYQNGDYPIEYYTQCLHYMIVTGVRQWYLAVLVFGTDLLEFTIEYDEIDAQALINAERVFWHENVQKNIPPPADGSESTRRALGIVYPAGDGFVTAGEADDQNLSALWNVKESIRQLRSKEDLYKNVLKARMQDADTLLGSQYYATWKSTSKSDRVFRIAQSKGA